MIATDVLWLALVFFAIAFLYSSVGFGGGSSYLALLTLFFSSFLIIRSTALLCNLVVVTGSSLIFYKKGYVEFKKFLPFIVTSVPMAFLGANFRLTEQVFFVILGSCLIIAALALTVQTRLMTSQFVPKKYAKSTLYGLGAIVGLLSGLVGIGGGIFLAPVLHYMKWDKPMVIAALASFFILVNSVSGIVGLLVSDMFELLNPEWLLFVVAVFLGGQLGVRTSLKKISVKGIRLLTAILVLLVGFRVLLNNGLQINIFS